MEGTRPRFMGRALTSVIVASAFGMLLVSGIVLFVSPPGRVANWSGWRMLGLSKHDWAGIHVWFAVLFILGAAFHIFFNLRPLLGYFKDRYTRRVGFRFEWVAGIGITVLVFAGTKAGVVPFETLLSWNEEVKQSWEGDRTPAPIPHAELLRLRELSEKASVAYDVAVDRLEARGYKGIRPDVIIARLASSNGVAPQRIYEIIQGIRGGGYGGSGRASVATGKAGSEGGALDHGGPGGFGGGGGPGGGAGRKTLAEYCSSRGIDLKTAIDRLATVGITAKPERTLREIATEGGFDRPYAIIDVVEGK